MKELSIQIDTKKYPKEDICYAAYKMSGNYYVQIEKSGRNKIKVIFTPKNNCHVSMLEIKSMFFKELKDESIRQKVSMYNAGLREFMIVKGIGYNDKQLSDEDSELTPEQEKELQNIIAQVEKEIKRSSNKEDPLGITQTWEERYGYGNPVKKQKK